MFLKENSKFLILDAQQTAGGCMETFFNQVLQLRLAASTVLQLVVMEYPAAVHCRKTDDEADLTTCKAEARRLRFAVHSFVSFFHIHVLL